ncbi:trans-2-enoyl-CoA reductase [Loigolactobacillus bifermentans DSM 20003]|uniref:trans-2-enoyl-CoA reductase (NAD(+)) n=1 Tax=Loigolactobacillus bifermentans DSM 20003 TaxID=1423726 RepID=A0A0R1H0B5_9LACO|nr:trans-2-enoyl-CoA reductase [Loigolactobacillus bifermentans DSM 20003]
MGNKINAIQGQSVICVSKAVTTKASLVIPKLSIYCLALYKVMLDKGTHETPIMHKDRVYRDMLYGNTPSIDAEGRLRPDSWERDFDTQEKTKALMAQITPENFKSGRFGYQTLRHEFMNLNGFDVDGAGNQTIDFDEIIQLKP